MQSKAEIFAELRPALMKLARRMLGSETEAEDLVQEAETRTSQAAQSLGDSGNPCFVGHGK